MSAKGTAAEVKEIEAALREQVDAREKNVANYEDISLEIENFGYEVRRIASVLYLMWAGYAYCEEGVKELNMDSVVLDLHHELMECAVGMKKLASDLMKV